RHLRAEGRQQFFDAIHHLDRVCPGLPLNREDDGARIIEPARRLVVLDAVNDAPEFFQSDGRAVAVRDDDRAVSLGGSKLPGSLYGKSLVGTVERAGRQIYVRFLHGLLRFINADAARRQRVRVQLHAHRVFLRAHHLHLRHAADHGDALRDQRLGVLVHGREQQRRRSQRQIDDRLIRRIDFLGRRRAGHARRQLPLRFGDGGLHVLRRRVNVAVEAELNGDLRTAERPGRGHVVHAGDGGELLLERRRDGRRHRLRVGAGQRRRDLDGREIDVRQIVYGEQPIAHYAEDQDGRHDERRGYWATYEWLSDVHWPPP